MRIPISFFRFHDAICAVRSFPQAVAFKEVKNAGSFLIGLTSILLPDIRAGRSCQGPFRKFLQPHR